MKYDDPNDSDSCESSEAEEEAITTTPAVLRLFTELKEKSAAGSAPLTREMAPVWQASSIATVTVEGSEVSFSRSSKSSTSSSPMFKACARACPE